MARAAAVALLSIALCGGALAQAPAPAPAQAEGHDHPAGEKGARPANANAPHPSAEAAAAEHGRPSGGGLLSLLPADSVTEHSLKTDNGQLAYSATAGTLNLFGQSGDRTAAIFYTSYVARDAGSNRPITFVFNGGPGAASAFLHLGLVGPKILDFGPSGRDGGNAKLVDNPQSWLTFTDLVLIDPIGTGWSRTEKADDASNFYGVQPDAQAMAKAIALYLAHTGRTSSPKYLFGESYGGFRAVKVAETLREEQGIIVSGLVMLSPLVDGSLIWGANRSALGAALQLPSLAAAELERHDALTDAAVRDAVHFAMTDYLVSLAGPAPQGDAAQAFYGRVAQMTGLPGELVTKSRGFVRDAYLKHLRESDHGVVSRYDVTFAAPDPYPESDSERGDDPVLDGFVRAYGGAFANYARNELGFKTEMTYTLLAGDVNGKWKWGGHGNGSRRDVNVSDDLRELLSLTPSLRVLIAHGYSDLVTPFSVSQYVIDHLPRELAADRVALKLYRGGHMLYTNRVSRLAFTEDAKRFFAQAAPASATND